MPREALIGTWKLVSMEFRDAGGRSSFPMGRDATGYLTYTPDARMWAVIVSPNRPMFASMDMRKAAPEEKIAAFDTCVSYCGTYEVRGDTVIHHVQASLYPNWVGGEQERRITWEGARLRLSSPPMPIDGAPLSAHLVWEPIGAAPPRPV